MRPARPRAVQTEPVPVLGRRVNMHVPPDDVERWASRVVRNGWHARRHHLDLAG